MSSAIRSSRTSSRIQCCQQTLSIYREGCMPNLGAAGCRWSDIKFHSASHLVVALAGQENSRRAGSGLWQATLSQADPPVTLRQGCTQLIRRVPQLQPSIPSSPAKAATSTHPSESLPASQGKKSMGLGIMFTGGPIRSPPGMCQDLSLHFLLCEIRAHTGEAGSLDLGTVGSLVCITVCGGAALCFVGR